ncbi:MAG: hypothetical protein H6603_01290 [Flavobacteriales bacterium]|nr:hypothetical protein [Flavobacteriales bacterium]MCB9203584.1 hypothetical protein [Flavobacteriales bacterium]
MRLRISVTIGLLFLLAGIVQGQGCYLAADMMMDGSVFRKSAAVVYDDDRNELRFETIRLGDDYSLKVVYIQSTYTGLAVNMVVNGHTHPLELELYGGALLKLLPQMDKMVRSKAEKDRIVYENTYVLSKEQVKGMALMPVTKVTIKCIGTELKRGVESDNIELSIANERVEIFTKDMGCLVRDVPETSSSSGLKPNKFSGNQGSVEIKPQEKGVAQESSANNPSLTTTDSLLLEIVKRLETFNKVGGEKEVTPRVFGFGVYVKTNYYFSEVFVPMNVDMDLLSAKFLAGTSINMSFNAAMRKRVGFRFEPYLDFLFSNSQEENSGGSQRLKASAHQIESGLRLLLVVRRNRVNIYPGITGGYVNLNARNASETIGSVGYSRQSLVRHGGSIGVLFGGEYLVTPHFGIRLETGLLYYIIGNQESTTTTNFGSGENTQSQTLRRTDGRFSTLGRLGGSFYF